jgi:hypothetical protein
MDYDINQVILLSITSSKDDDVFRLSMTLWCEDSAKLYNEELNKKTNESNFKEDIHLNIQNNNNFTIANSDNYKKLNIEYPEETLKALFDD